MNRTCFIAASCAAGVIALSPASRAGAQIPPSIEFRVPKPPTVAVSDSGAFLAYELHVTNLAANPMALKRVDVLDAERGDNVVFSLADSALFRAVARPAPSLPPGTPLADRAQVGPGLRAYVYLWMPVDRDRPPTRLRHRLTFQRVGGDSSVHVLEGTVIPVERNAAVIMPPLRGEWAALNGPSNSSGHRRLVLALEGHVASGQRFAIDFLQVDSSGRTHRGDPLKNDSYYAYGSDVLAVNDGIVVATRDSIPENIPGAQSRAVPINLVTVGGNHLAIDIGQGRYALYAHVRPGSLRVRVGDRVKRGQVIASLGNSGNSTEPHLHFQVADQPNFLAGEGVPYAMEQFEVIGTCLRISAAACTRTTPVVVKRGIPMLNQLVRFPK